MVSRSLSLKHLVMTYTDLVAVESSKLSGKRKQLSEMYSYPYSYFISLYTVKSSVLHYNKKVLKTSQVKIKNTVLQDCRVGP